jgi:serine/threonine protein kinase
LQDRENLYLVMEYVRGGDLTNLLMKKVFLEESVAR